MRIACGPGARARRGRGSGCGLGLSAGEAEASPALSAQPSARGRAGGTVQGLVAARLLLAQAEAGAALAIPQQSRTGGLEKFGEQLRRSSALPRSCAGAARDPHPALPQSCARPALRASGLA